MPIFSIFPSTSKMSILAQHSNYKRAYFGSTDDRIVHKKFQRFQKWVQMLLKTSIKVVSRHSCQYTSVAISQFSHVRIWWYIAHFDPFNVLIHLHLISWMGTVMRLRAYCVSGGHRVLGSIHIQLRKGILYLCKELWDTLYLRWSYEVRSCSNKQE